MEKEKLDKIIKLLENQQKIINEQEKLIELLKQKPPIYITVPQPIYYQQLQFPFYYVTC